MKTKQIIAAGGLALSLAAGIGLGANVAEAAAPIGAVAKAQPAVHAAGGQAGVEQVNYYHRPYYGRPYYGWSYRPYRYWGPPVVYRPAPYYYAPYYAPPAYYYPY